MVQPRHEHQSFFEHGAEIIVVGSEGARTFGRFGHNYEVPFMGIPDPAHRIAPTYRQEVNLLKLGRMPALLIINEHMGQSMSDIPSHEKILAVLDSQNAVEDPH